jgi:hypothetical protein
MNLRSMGPEAAARAKFKNSSLHLSAGKLAVPIDEDDDSGFGPGECVGLRERLRDAPLETELFPCDSMRPSGATCRR